MNTSHCKIQKHLQRQNTQTKCINQRALLQRFTRWSSCTVSTVSTVDHPTAHFPTFNERKQTSVKCIGSLTVVRLTRCLTLDNIIIGSSGFWLATPPSARHCLSALSKSPPPPPPPTPHPQPLQSATTTKLEARLAPEYQQVMTENYNQQFDQQH